MAYAAAKTTYCGKKKVVKNYEFSENVFSDQKH